MKRKRSAAASSLPETAFRFVLILGLVNLFADVSYEGGTSLNGPFLGSLGASAGAISILVGLAEFFGYSLRLAAGWVADKTGKHWPVTFLGYAINLLAVPVMAIAPTWQVAAILIVCERIGRAIRKPTVEAMLSYTTAKHGKGWVYAVNTAMDETGATIGPLLMALVLFLGGSYRTGYAWLLISSLCALVCLAVARIQFPLPAKLEKGGAATAHAGGFTASYWLYMVAGALFAAGLMSFEFVSSHWANTGVVSREWIPLFLAIATGVGVIASLVLGKLYDRVGIRTVVVAVCLSACFSPLVFLGGFYVALAGLMLWGIGYATQDTLLKALIASVLPEGKRNLAFGLFYVGYGSGWLVGSVTAGLLYEHFQPALILFAVSAQLASVPFFVLAARKAHAAGID